MVENKKVHTNRKTFFRILCLLVSPLSTSPSQFRECHFNKLVSERAFISTSLYTLCSSALMTNASGWAIYDVF